MNILLISQCDKRALAETRRILDQFAERRGDRTWQTPITQAGLDMLHKLLRKTARKNTAVACHWIRGRDHSELLWIVGDASCFNAEGAVPTNTTARDVLRRKDENGWHSLVLIRSLTGMAALLHDLGKACDAFQQRLRKLSNDKNLFRHEWITLVMLQSFIGNDDDTHWLQRLIDVDPNNNKRWLIDIQQKNFDYAKSKPFATLPPLARAIGWLIVSHHRLPEMPDKKDDGFRSEMLKNLLEKIDANWNEWIQDRNIKNAQNYRRFRHGLPITEDWQKRAARHAKSLQKMLRHINIGTLLADPFIMHAARLVLMLADHHYSARLSDSKLGDTDFLLYANTWKNRDSDKRDLNQRLDEHLLGVERQTGIIVHALPDFEHHLPRLTRHRKLRERTKKEVFRWQNRAADLAAAMQETATKQGAFIVNMASTGCGKTFANARIMYELTNPAYGMRCAFALGLRTLTLQTGRNFRELLNLSDDELAIRTGGVASRELFEFNERQAEETGSASSMELISEDSHVTFEGNFDQPLLARVLRDAVGHEAPAHKLLAAPILVCTVDHLMPATESLRGGHQIVPMLRLMSGDLVLDELDDFDVDDFPALTRLIYWAGLLGSKVLISSATLLPSLVEGMFEAYRRGREHYQQNRGEYPDEPPFICCAWIDEFHQTRTDCANDESFAEAHRTFAKKRYDCLEKTAKVEPRRRARLIPFAPSAGNNKTAIRAIFAEEVLKAAFSLHSEHYLTDQESGKRISFGLIRMANIDPLVEVALALYAREIPFDYRIHLCVYHSRFPLLIRSRIEKQLDAALNRRDSDTVFQLDDIRQRIDAHPETNHLFIVLGSPVTEVGRDHDYDWAVVEPSSMRSLIQLAGRVRRHRVGACTSPNIMVFNTNLRHFEHLGTPAFCKPGFENKSRLLGSHFLEILLRETERDIIDARPRLLKNEEDFNENTHLADLEHAALEAMCRWRDGNRKINACGIWVFPQAHLTTVLVRHHPFRLDLERKTDVMLKLNEDGDDYVLTKIFNDPKHCQTAFIPLEGKNYRIDDALVSGERISPWGVFDYLVEVETLAQELDISPDQCAERYGTVTLPDNTQGWRFHPTLGFTRKK